MKNKVCLVLIQIVTLTLYAQAQIPDYYTGKSSFSYDRENYVFYSGKSTILIDNAKNVMANKKIALHKDGTPRRSEEFEPSAPMVNAHKQTSTFLEIFTIRELAILRNEKKFWVGYYFDPMTGRTKEMGFGIDNTPKYRAVMSPHRIYQLDKGLKTDRSSIYFNIDKINYAYRSTLNYLGMLYLVPFKQFWEASLHTADNMECLGLWLGYEYSANEILSPYMKLTKSENTPLGLMQECTDYAGNIYKFEYDGICTSVTLKEMGEGIWGEFIKGFTNGFNPLEIGDKFMSEDEILENPLSYTYYTIEQIELIDKPDGNPEVTFRINRNGSSHALDITCKYDKKDRTLTIISIRAFLVELPQ